MAPTIDDQFKDLLTPVKSIEESFAVNISSLLENYIRNFVQGNVPGSFNSAALIIQNTSSIYMKKVEYLMVLANQLYDVLVRNKNDGPAKKDPKSKDRHKETKYNDPFLSTEIKPGKNLSCLRKKNVLKTSAGKKKTSGIVKKPSNQKFLFVPVDLLPLEGEEKGETFYDTRGDPIGNKNDYIINKCRVIQSGWLLMPTISPAQIPTEDTPYDYTLHNTYGDLEDMCTDDEGVDMCLPPSTGNSENEGMPKLSQPATDDGLGSSLDSSPMDSGPDSQPNGSQDVASMEDIENIPVGDVPKNLDLPPVTPRRSSRHALQQVQQEAAPSLLDENPIPAEEEVTAVKKAIQKKNTLMLPSKLRQNQEKKKSLIPLSEFCARTFFVVENNILRKYGSLLDIVAFTNNTSYVKILGKLAEFNKISTKKAKGDDVMLIAHGEEDADIDVEQMQDEEYDDISPPFDPLVDDDIVLSNDLLPRESNENPIGDMDPVNISTPVEAAPVPNFDEIAHEQLDFVMRDIQQYVQNSDISERVHQWEKTIKPFLDTLNKRESFDINLYGSRILNSFEDSNRKQTMTFKNFCKNKQKWEIHRYFMALLPLANIGNVDITSEAGENGEEEICITLLSRKMHHKELEEFGHSDGEHP